jgi:Trypsin-co-occurring domain 1
MLIRLARVVAARGTLGSGSNDHSSHVLSGTVTVRSCHERRPRRVGGSVSEVAVLRYEDGTLVAVDGAAGAVTESGAVYEMRLDVRDVLGSLEEIASEVGQKVAAIGAGLRQRIPHRPDEVTIELGIALEGSGGLPVIARASGEVHLKVVATWRRDDIPGDQHG